MEQGNEIPDKKTFDAFFDRNYLLCARRADTYKHELEESFYLWITSLRRLGEGSMLETLKSKIELIPHDTLEYIRAKMLLGDCPLDRFASTISDDETAAAYHSLYGTHLLSEGKVQQARKEFQSCLAISQPTLYHLIAQSQLEWPSQRPVPADIIQSFQEWNSFVTSEDGKSTLDEKIRGTEAILARLESHDGLVSQYKIPVLLTLIIFRFYKNDIAECQAKSKSALDYIENIGPGEAVEKVLDLTDDLSQIAESLKNFELCEQALLHNIRVRLRYQLGSPQDVQLKMLRASFSQAKQEKLALAKSTLEDALEFTKKVGITRDNFAEFISTIDAILELLKEKDLEFNNLAEILFSIDFNDDSNKLDFERYQVVAACLKLWPFSNNEAKQEFSKIIQKCFFFVGKSHTETLCQLTIGFEALAAELTKEGIHIDTISEGFAQTFEQIEPSKPAVTFFEKIVRCASLRYPLSEKFLNDLLESFSASVRSSPALLFHFSYDRLLKVCELAFSARDFQSAIKIADILNTESSLAENTSEQTSRATYFKGVSLLSISDINNAISELERAHSFLKQAKTENSQLEAQISNALGVAYAHLQDKKSIDLFDHSYQLAKEITPDKSTYEKILYNQCSLHNRNREYSTVIDILQKFFSDETTSKPSDESRSILKLVEAEALIGLRQFHDAYQILKKFDENAENIQDGYVKQNFFLLLAYCFANVGNWRESVDAAVELLKIFKSQSREILRFSSDKDWRNHVKHGRGYFQALLTILSEGKGYTSDDISKVWLLLEERDTVFQDFSIIEQNIQVQNKMDDFLVRELIEIRQKIKNIRLFGAPRQKEKDLAEVGERSKISFETLQNLYERRKTLQRELRGSDGFSHALEILDSKRANDQSINAILDYHIIEIISFETGPLNQRYADGDQVRTRFALFCKPAYSDIVYFWPSAPLHDSLFALPDFEEEVRKLNENQLEQKIPDKSFNDHQNRLSLIKDALVDLFSNARAVIDHEKSGRISIVADSVFQDICLSEITWNDKMLIDYFAVSFSRSLSKAIENQPAPVRTDAPNHSALIICAPDFDAHTKRFPSFSLFRKKRKTTRSRSILTHFDNMKSSRKVALEKDFEALDGAALEGESVAKYLSQKVCMGRDATVGKLNEFHKYRIIHLATHAFYFENIAGNINQDLSEFLGGESVFYSDPEHLLHWSYSLQLEDPLYRSGFALSGANNFLNVKYPDREFGTGLVLSADLLDLDLRGVDLVFLSACETGVGQVRDGEGVAGLQQAFLTSGVRTLIVSSWSIPDTVTTLLVDKFYEGLIEHGMPIEDALREAQCYVRDVDAATFNRELDRIEKMFGWVESKLPRLGSDAPKQPFADPWWWGAFRCIGDGANKIVW